MPDFQERFTERHGGMVVAVGFHAAFFVLLSLWQVPEAAIVRTPDPDPIRIELTPVEPVEAAEQQAPLQPPTAARTVAGEPADAEELNDAPEAEADRETAPERGETLKQVAALPRPPQPRPEPARPTAPPPVPVEALEPADDGRLPQQVKETQQEAEEAELELIGEQVEELSERDAAFFERLEQQRTALNNFEQSYDKYGSYEVAARLKLARVELNGKRWLETTDGTMEGVIRSLSTTDVPPDVAERVLSRYGIEIFYKYLDGTPGRAQNFLNQAQTSGGTYHNRVAKGHYQVFSFSQAAISRMVQLEIDALRRQGHDPAKTRVLEVEYGIVPTANGFDLGVKRIDVAPMEFDPEVP